MISRMNYCEYTLYIFFLLFILLNQLKINQINIDHVPYICFKVGINMQMNEFLKRNYNSYLKTGRS